MKKNLNLCMNGYYMNYSLFHKKRYAFSLKVSKIFIPFFYVLTVRSKGYGVTTDSFQSCSQCQILHNIKL